MKHPVRDRLMIVLCAAASLLAAAASVGLLLGRLSLAPAIELMNRVNNNAAGSIRIQIALAVLAIVLVAFAALLISVVLPSKKKRSSSFAYQQNENGMVRISLKALEALVQRCLNQHAELKVITSSMFSDEETVRVDVHITLQSDISMPLAISALQKQIKRYLEACSGVSVQEVRVFVDGTMPATEETAASPYAIPSAMLGLNAEALPNASEPALKPADDASANDIQAEAPVVCEADEPAEPAGDEGEPSGEDEGTATEDVEPAAEDGETAADQEEAGE